MRLHSIASMLVGLLLSRAVSSAVISSLEEGIIARRQAVNSSELSLVTFNLDEISVVSQGQTVYPCDQTLKDARRRSDDVILLEPTIFAQRNSLTPPYARCKPIVDLVLWYTSPAGGNTKSEKYVHSTNKNSKTRMGNMYFDNNLNAIKLSHTEFFHEPGSGAIGAVNDANRAYSNIVDWATTDNIKIDIETGGAGSISVYSFIA